MSRCPKNREKAPETTPQMVILGMNSNDEDVSVVSSSRREAVTTPASTWFSIIGIFSSLTTNNGVAVGPAAALPQNRDDEPSKDDEDNQNQSVLQHDYSAMGDEATKQATKQATKRAATTTRQKHHLRHCRLAPLDITSDMVYAALGPPSPSTTALSLLDNDNSNSNNNYYDENFFFRPTDGTSFSPKRRADNHHWKTLRRNTRHSELFEYSDAVETLPAPMLQRYRKRYAQLNQEIILSDREDQCTTTQDVQNVINHNDLQLHQHNTNNDAHDIAGSSTFRTVSQSNLVYEADGKRLMRLPRDRIRLLMDPDLEPGILSVEENVGYHHDDHDDYHAIQYVLTVDDGLYRKILMEMSPRYFTDAKLDMRFAYLALSLLLIFLLINIFAFHES